MSRFTWCLMLECVLSLALATTALAQKIRIVVDQDARGPGTSDQQALLVFLQSDKFEVLGITTVSGDQWVKEETQHTLRMLEIAQRTDVPVIQGAEFLSLIPRKKRNAGRPCTENWSTRAAGRTVSKPTAPPSTTNPTTPRTLSLP